jgi:hypothetical protein
MHSLSPVPSTITSYSSSMAGDRRVEAAACCCDGGEVRLTRGSERAGNCVTGPAWKKNAGWDLAFGECEERSRVRMGCRSLSHAGPPALEIFICAHAVLFVLF